MQSVVASLTAGALGAVNIQAAVAVPAVVVVKK
jgi:hypothetical protein